MMFRVHVWVAPRADLIDPAGEATCAVVQAGGWPSVRAVRLGKAIALDIEAADRASAVAEAQELARALLAHPVTEDWTVLTQDLP